MSDSIALTANARSEATGGDPTGNSGIKILTVDDNEALRYSIVRSLRDAGYQVTEASTGVEALALAEQLPDLITLDVNLPDMNGFSGLSATQGQPVYESHTRYSRVFNLR